MPVPANGLGLGPATVRAHGENHRGAAGVGSLLLPGARVSALRRSKVAVAGGHWPAGRSQRPRDQTKVICPNGDWRGSDKDHRAVFFGCRYFGLAEADFDQKRPASLAGLADAHPKSSVVCSCLLEFASLFLPPRSLFLSCEFAVLPRAILDGRQRYTRKTWRFGPLESCNWSEIAVKFAVSREIAP